MKSLAVTLLCRLHDDETEEFTSPDVFSRIISRPPPCAEETYKMNG